MPVEALSTAVITIGASEAYSSASEAIAVKALAELYAGAPSPGEVLREGARPLRVMLLAPEQSVYQRFCARDMNEAFASLGAETMTCLIKHGHSWRLEFLDLVGQHRPDALFVFSQRRRNLPELPRELAVLGWDQDCVCGFDSGGIWRIGPRDRIWTLMDEWREQMDANGVESNVVGHLNMGANTNLYYPPNEDVEYEHEVLFVGNIHPFEQYLKMVQFENWPKAAQSIMLHARDRLFEWIRTRDEHEPFVIPEIEMFLLESADAIGVTVSTEMAQWATMVRFFRYRIAHYVVRERMIESLSGFRLGLYGHGWDRFPSLAPYAKPAINNGPEMLRVMHRSAVHVQLHTWTVHHPRLYDTAAAGGYLLVGRVPERRPLELEFEVGQELDSFGSIAELHKKIRHALDHPDMMRSMGARAAERVLREHTMTHSASQVLEELQRD